MRRQLITATVVTLVLAVLTGIVYPAAVWVIGQVAFTHRANGSFIKDAEGQVIGSSLIGQEFLDDKGNPVAKYFQPRPSSAGTGYTGNASAASNLGPGDPRLVGFIPGLNTVGLDGAVSKTNPFATPSDPYCVPVDTTGAPVLTPTAGQKYEKNKDGSYVCDTNTVPERAMAYRLLNGLDPKVLVPVDAVTGSFSGLDPDISVANADLQAARVAKARSLSPATVLVTVKAHTDQRLLGILGEKTVNVLDLNLALDRLH